jgi:hypothetical protein
VSRNVDDSHYEAFLAFTDYDPEFVEAEAYLARALGIELGPGEHFGDDWVLTPDDSMLRRCREVVAWRPRAEVLEALVVAFEGSYHRQPVHRLLTDIARMALGVWRDGDRSNAQRSLIRQVGNVYKYGTKPADLDLLLDLCDEPTFTPPTIEDGDEDFRGYWFEALAKIKDPRVTEFCRAIAQRDLDHDDEPRVLLALRVLGKTTDPAIAALITRIATEHPDSEARRIAKRILKRHT